VVAYHAWWPSSNDPFYRANISENTARINYYPPDPDGYRYTPYGFADGVTRGYSYAQWIYWIMARYEVDSPLEITLEGTYDAENRDGNLHISITATDEINLNGLRVRIALTEDSLYFQAPNGTPWHNYVMRDMIPNPTGAALNISRGEIVEMNQEFSISEDFDSHFCKLIVWVQADQSDYEVLQAARIDIEALSPLGIEDQVQLPDDFGLGQNYPNPFNASTSIAYRLDKPSQVDLAVYDLAGRKVATLVSSNQQAGAHQVIWHGLDDRGESVSSGVYFYKLTADGRSVSNRMTLLK
jgi:hypothetical protein